LLATARDFYSKAEISTAAKASDPE